jgi:hypothetical protein
VPLGSGGARILGGGGGVIIEFRLAQIIIHINHKGSLTHVWYGGNFSTTLLIQVE